MCIHATLLVPLLPYRLYAYTSGACSCSPMQVTIYKIKSFNNPLNTSMRVEKAFSLPACICFLYHPVHILPCAESTNPSHHFPPQMGSLHCLPSLCVCGITLSAPLKYIDAFITQVQGLPFCTAFLPHLQSTIPAVHPQHTLAHTSAQKTLLPCNTRVHITTCRVISSIGL